MASFILVHGEFAGGWCWQPVVDLLERDGHVVSAPDLPGSGEDDTPVSAVTLDAYAGTIAVELARSGEPAILVGHGLGGVVITQAAARSQERIARLVYVAAYLPRDGQSAIDLARLPEGAEDQVQANLTIEGDPAVGVLSDKALARALYNCAGRGQLDWALEHAHTQALEPLMEPVVLGGHTPDPEQRVYIHCLQDHAIPLALQRRMVADNPCASVAEIDTDHCPLLSRPNSVSRLLVAAAESLRSRQP